MWILARSADKKAPTIAKELGINKQRVYRIIKRGHPTPTKPKGAPRKLSEDQLDKIIEFITENRKHRQMPYYKVYAKLELPVAKDALNRALQSQGYHRRVAIRKPDISPTNRRKRLQWAYDHRYWTRRDWINIIWTDETWVTGGFHKKMYITRQQGEEFDDDCIRKRHRDPG